MQLGSTSLSHTLLIAALCAAATLSAHDAWSAEKQPSLDVPYVPTPQAVVDKMLELGNVSADDYVIDLGSGDGRIPVTAAKRYGARAMGVDLNPVRIQEAEENAREQQVTDKVEFKVQNLYDTPIGEANVLTMYLLPRVNLDLRPRILEELKPGSRVVSHAFDMGDWRADRHEMVEGKTVYLWVVPARVEGAWQVKGDKPFTLELTQNFQEVSGTATVDGKPTPLTDVSLKGTALRFVLDGATYAGVVNEQGITAKDGSWLAVRP